MTTNKNGATVRAVSPTQHRPGNPAKQDHFTSSTEAFQAIPSTTTCANSPEAWGTGKSTLPLFNIFAQIARPHLTPREQRCLDALIAHPEGIKSYDLRVLTCCSYVPDVVQRLIAKGYRITCTMVPDGMTVDGKPYSIGVYRLVGQGGQR